MSIDQEIAKLKKEVIEKTDSSFRVVKHVDDIGEVLVVYVEKTGNEVVMINKETTPTELFYATQKADILTFFIRCKTVAL